MNTLRKWLTGLAISMIALALLRQGTALAACRITTSSGSDDVVICDDNPPDPDGINTGSGSDKVTIQSGVTITTSGNTILTGYGADQVHNYGTLRSGQDPVDLGTGNDQLFNYGVLHGDDDGVGCSPASGQVCTINNYGTITAVMEAVDYRDVGGTGIIYNEGTITSTREEAIHLNRGTSYQVTNLGTIRAGSSAIEVYRGQLRVENHGRIEADGYQEVSGTWVEYSVNGDSAADTVINAGEIVNNNSAAVALGGGSDVIENTGAITARNRSSSRAAVMGEDGSDRITNSGSISETGSGFAAIDAGHGSDTVVIRGGTIRGLISGDPSSGGRSEDTDTLVFEFTGTQSEVDTFRAQVNSQSARSGQAAWKGLTYAWRGFERIQLDLTVSGSSSPPPPTGTLPPTATPPPPDSVLPTGYYEDSHTAIAYSSGWFRYSSSGGSGGSYNRTNVSGATAAFQFDGSRVTIFRTLYSSRGPMDVCIDDACQRIENHSATVQYQAPVTFDVSSGTHTVVIRNLSTRYIDLDAVEINGSAVGGTMPTSTPPPTSTPAPAQTTLSAGYYENDHPAIVYSSGWSFYGANGASGGSYLRTNVSGATATFQFNGSRVTIYRTLASNRGPAEVCVDGACQSVDNYSASTQYAVPLAIEVSSGTHTVTIRHLGSAYIDLDAVRIDG